MASSVKSDIKKSGRLSLHVVFLFVLLSVGLSYIFYGLAQFYLSLDRFSFYVRNYDKDMAEKELANIKEHYNHFSSLKMGRFSDRFLFQDMFLYEASVLKLKENYEGAIVAVKDRGDDHRALFITAISKFRLYEAAYQSEAVQKDKEIRGQIIQDVVSNVRSDFEKVVRDGPGPDKAFSYSFNYDLTSEEENAQKAFEKGGRLESKFILGRPRGEDPGQGSEPSKKDQFGKNIDKEQPGSGGARKKG